MRPEAMASIGYQIFHLREGVKAALLSQIYNVVMEHGTDEQTESFTKFYAEMLIGMDEQARELGAQPRTLEELRNKITELGLSESLEAICMALIRLMEPPEPIDQF